MSTYESAPATKLLASHCACCGRPLLDSVSVETGVGPECRKKHGFTEAQTEPNWAAVFAALAGLPIAGLRLPFQDGPEAVDATWRLGGVDTRKVANKLVYLIAEEASGADHGPAFVTSLVNALKALGFTKLSDRISTRLVAVHIWTTGAELVVRAPYDEGFLAKARTVPGRRWDAASKVTKFPVARKGEVWAALRACFPGRYGTGDKGLFVIPAVTSVAKAA